MKIRWVILPGRQESDKALEKPLVSYCIEDLNSFIEHLKASDVEIEKTEKTEDGLFAYIHDPEGNRIELFQASKA